jgi:hypothetical protein
MVEKVVLTVGERDAARDVLAVIDQDGIGARAGGALRRLRRAL